MPTPSDLTDAERFAANAILDAWNDDPDSDAMIVARAALRLATPLPEGQPQRPFVYGYADGHAPLPEGAAPSLDVERLTYFLVAAAVHDGMQGDFPSIRAEAEWIAAQWNDPDSITNARLAAYLRESLPQPQG